MDYGRPAHMPLSSMFFLGKLICLIYIGLSYLAVLISESLRDQMQLCVKSPPSIHRVSGYLYGTDPLLFSPLLYSLVIPFSAREKGKIGKDLP